MLNQLTSSHNEIDCDINMLIECLLKGKGKKIKHKSISGNKLMDKYLLNMKLISR
jgi:hypothetical protein